MRWSNRLSLPALLLTLALAACAGCRRSPEPRGEPPAAPRIVSMSPALSRTLIDLDLGDRLVGRSAFCRSVPEDLPIVGNLHEVDYERLIRLQPTHVLLQPPSASGPDPQLARVADEHGWIVAHWTINSVEDIEQVIRDLPGVIYPQDSAEQAAAAGRAATLLNEIAAELTPRGGPPAPQRVLLVADVEPVWVFGRRTYLDDVLTALGGGNAVAAEGWVELSLEDVSRLDPDAVIVVRDVGDPEPDPMEAAGPLTRLDIAACRDRRIAVLWHPDAKLPSSGVRGVAKQMRRVLAALAEPGGHE
jgi:ABC-type hemin transport system substrate-binding protein